MRRLLPMLAPRGPPLARGALRARALSNASGQEAAAGEEASSLRSLAPIGASALLVLGSVLYASGLFAPLKSDQRSVKRISSEVAMNNVRNRTSSNTGESGPVYTGDVQSVGEKVTPQELRLRYEYRTQGGANRKRISVIGKGAYGRVVSAIARGSGQEVAMKVVSNRAMTAEALLREVEVLRRVRGHDNIIHLLEVLECDKEWYLVTELCEGGDLLDRLIQQGPFAESTAAQVLASATSALEHVHRCGYVHGDVKPENIVFVHPQAAMLANDVRLVDFGMSQPLSTLEQRGGLPLLFSSKSAPSPEGAGGGVRVGTIAYWSPEQVRLAGPGTATPPSGALLKTDPRKCDVWAMGVVLFIALLGYHPFDEKGEGVEEDIAQRILQGKVNYDLHGSRLTISPLAKDLLSKMLEPDPAKRLSTAQVLEHPWVSTHDVSSSQSRKLSRLPTSWAASGFSPVRNKFDDIVEAAPGTPHHARIAAFKTQEASRAFTQALLLAAVAVGSADLDESQRSSDLLFQVAFNILDVKGEGIVTSKGIEQLALALGSDPASGGLLSAAVQRGLRAVASSTAPPKRSLSSSPSSSSTSSSSSRFVPGIELGEFEALLRANQCVSRTFAPGQAVFLQGALPQGIYLLARGSARVEWSPQTGTVVTGQEYATIPAGSIIGETALVQGRAERSATVRIVTESQVVFVPKDEFLLAVASSRALHDKIFSLTREQQAARVSQLVEKLHPSSRRLVSFGQGEVVFRQGDKADVLYLIQEGLVEVSVRGPASAAAGAREIHVSVGQRGAGDIIGTSAVDGGKRHTSATCLSPVRAVAITHADLHTLLRDMPIFRFYIESQKRWRNENWQTVLSDMERGVSEPQILPMLGEDVDEDSGRAFDAYRKELDAAPLRSLQAGEFMFKRGEQSSWLFVLERGRADVELRGPDGSVMTVAQLGPGDHIGEQALLDGRPQYAFSVRCVTPCEFRAMGEARFHALIREQPPFARAVRLAMRQRRHRWVRNMLSLAHSEKKNVLRIALEPGDMLFKIGDPVEKLYYVHRGEIRVVNSEGEVVRTLGAGDTIGWEVFREGGSVCNATATCTSAKTVVSALPKVALDELISTHRYVSPQLETYAREGSAPDVTMVRRKSIR